MRQQITILYIDDEPINLMLFDRVFNKDYNIITAESGVQGLELLKSHSNIEIIITDMKMPKMSGLEFVTEAKKDFPGLHYFLLTGYDITEEIKEAIECKIIEGSFSKPFRVNIITEAIKNVT